MSLVMWDGNVFDNYITAEGSLAEFEVFKENGEALRPKQVSKIFDKKPGSCVKINGNINITYATRALSRIDIVVKPRSK